MKRSNLLAASLGLAALMAGAGFSVSHAADSSGYLEAPVPAGEDAKYGVIDGHKLHQLVEEQAKIARDYRDAGHQWWGRIVGTSGDVAASEWLQGKFKQFGLSDVHAQPVAMFYPQWNAKSWSVVLVGGGKSLNLTSAQPPYGAPDTKGKELDLEVVYAGLGSAADFKGRDVHGKAVLVLKPGRGGPDLKFIESQGPAAIFIGDLRGGNHAMQAYRSYTNVPTFNLGTQDAIAIRDLTAGEAPHLKITMDAEWLPNQKTYLVWGTLPGATDETIYILGHRDGWFEASGDNGSGIAVMVGLAEYYSKIPQAQRKRTIVFVGTDGHHQVRPGTYGETWLVANRAKLFSKTALMINVEHPAEVLTHGDFTGDTTSIIPNEWYAGGPSRPELTKLAHDAFNEFGVPVWTVANTGNPPAGDLGPFRWFLPGVVVQSNDFTRFHTDVDSPDNVSWAGLQGVTRAYAKIIDGVNAQPLSFWQRPEEPMPTPTSGLDISKCQAWIKDSSVTCTP